MKLSFLRALRSMLSGSDLDRIASVPLEEFRDPRAASALRQALSRRQFLAGTAAVAIAAPLAPRIFLPARQPYADGGYLIPDEFRVELLALCQYHHHVLGSEFRIPKRDLTNLHTVHVSSAELTRMFDRFAAEHSKALAVAMRGGLRR